MPSNTVPSSSASRAGSVTGSRLWWGEPPRASACDYPRTRREPVRTEETRFRRAGILRGRVRGCPRARPQPAESAHSREAAMYEPPKARLDEAPVALGSVWMGLTGSWLAILMGVGLFAAWFVAAAFAVEKLGPSALVLSWIGLLLLPAPLVGLVIYLLRAGRSRSVLGAVIGAAIALLALGA